MGYRNKKNGTMFGSRSQIHQFELIRKSIKNSSPLGKVDYFTFAVQVVAGTIIIPIFLKLGIDLLLELLHNYIMENNLRKWLHPLYVVSDFYKMHQVTLFMVFVIVHWFRCNVKLYSYRYSRTATSMIIHQAKDYGVPVCPRCGEFMTLDFVTESERVQVGTKVKTYYAYDDSGPNARLKKFEDRTPVYMNEHHIRNFYICKNSDCGLKTKIPKKTDMAFYRFSEMPYRIKDALQFILGIGSKKKKNPGDVEYYRSGISLRGRLLLIGILFVSCDLKGYESIVFLMRKWMFVDFLELLYIPVICSLIAAAIVQVFIHLFQRKKDHGAPTNIYCRPYH